MCTPPPNHLGLPAVAARIVVAMRPSRACLHCHFGLVVASTTSSVISKEGAYAAKQASTTSAHVGNQCGSEPLRKLRPVNQVLEQLPEDSSTGSWVNLLWVVLLLPKNTLQDQWPPRVPPQAPMQPLSCGPKGCRDHTANHSEAGWHPQSQHRAASKACVTCGCLVGVISQTKAPALSACFT